MIKRAKQLPLWSAEPDPPDAEGDVIAAIRPSKDERRRGLRRIHRLRQALNSSGSDAR